MSKVVGNDEGSLVGSFEYTKLVLAEMMLEDFLECKNFFHRVGVHHKQAVPLLEEKSKDYKVLELEGADPFLHVLDLVYRFATLAFAEIAFDEVEEIAGEVVMVTFVCGVERTFVCEVAVMIVDVLYEETGEEKENVFAEVESAFVEESVFEEEESVSEEANACEEK